MDLATFSERSPGRLIPIAGIDGRTGTEFKHVAFLPDPLPDAVELSGSTWEVVSTAMQALGRADQASRNIPNPVLLRRPSLRREAQSTSALEGTHAVFSEVMEADVGGRAVTPEIREVLNYAEMAEIAIDAVATRPITVGQLCAWQGLLVRGTRSDGPDSGRIRETQVLIGPKDCPVAEARFVPPPAGDPLVIGFREWAEWIERDRPMSFAVQAALAHYQFETLHPFHDGNGRIGRLVIVLQMIRKGHLRDGLLTISPWLEARREEYQDALLRVSQTGDWNPWVTFFGRAVAAASEATVQRIERLLAYQAYVRTLVHERKPQIKGVAARIAEDLIGNPVVTPTASAKLYCVTYPAANNAVGRLVDAGILVEATGRSYDRVFFAPQVLRILES